MNVFVVLCKSCRFDIVCFFVVWGWVWICFVMFMSFFIICNGIFFLGILGRLWIGNFEINVKKDDKNVLFLLLGVFIKIKLELVGLYFFRYLLIIWIKKF